MEGSSEKSLVARTGFEPVISALRGRRPKPLDERACVKPKWMTVNVTYISHLTFSIIHFLLSRQGSNLNSSHPECDVLPITPRDSFY